MLGLGVMIDRLSGNEDTVKAVKESIGKTINSIEVTDDALSLGLEGGSKLILWDNGQSCCETRYMRSDDKLSDFHGSQLLDFELEAGPEDPEASEVRESQFLKVKTSKGVFTVVNYNEHNGYYGGFSINARIEN